MHEYSRQLTTRTPKHLATEVLPQETPLHPQISPADISSYIQREIVAIGQNCSVRCSCQIVVGVIQFK